MFKCVQYSWQEVYELCRELARKIKNSGFKPDAIVAVAGGDGFLQGFWQTFC